MLKPIRNIHRKDLIRCCNSQCSCKQLIWGINHAKKTTDDLKGSVINKHLVQRDKKNWACIASIMSRDEDDLELEIYRDSTMTQTIKILDYSITLC